MEEMPGAPHKHVTLMCIMDSVNGAMPVVYRNMTRVNTKYIDTQDQKYH